MADRYAILLDGLVTDIKLMDGPAPELPEDVKDKYEVIKADDGIQIGMVRGGPRYQVAGFGFSEDVPVQRYGLPDNERKAPAPKSEAKVEQKPGPTKTKRKAS